MWRRAYLLLVVVRLYLALAPSYLHPDENFQGPEPIAARVFSYPSRLPWEFTTDQPIRSAFPLWLVYGLPMYILRELFEGVGKDVVPPAVVFYTLRVLMFTLSFVCEDGAVYELVSSPRHRRVAVLLVASSYVTWSWQCHTFSNGVETCVLLWSVVLIGRILEDKKRSGVLASAFLGFLLVLGTFTRITFPAFVLIPCLRLLPHFKRKPFSLLSLALAAVFTTAIAVLIDIAFYSKEPFRFSSLWRNPILTPLNNLRYNSDASNLALHGTHPHYQHILINLPQLLGPAFLLLLLAYRRTWSLASALCGIAVLSLFPHQEARFLLPAVPLLLSSIRLPRNPVQQRAWISAWAIFNVVMGLLMGVYHQAGIVPAQLWIAAQGNGTGVTTFWWKTYTPPVWLLDGVGREHMTVDWMGLPKDEVLVRLQAAVGCLPAGAGTAAGGLAMGKNETVFLAAPYSATFLDGLLEPGNGHEVRLVEEWQCTKHVNMDDLDFEEDGVWGTVKRVVGRRGLVVWRVVSDC